jgi:hypothetical protein
MNTRGDSPQRADLNNHVMAQLNSQINSIDINDLPPPPPVPQVYFIICPLPADTRSYASLFFSIKCRPPITLLPTLLLHHP